MYVDAMMLPETCPVRRWSVELLWRTRECGQLTREDRGVNHPQMIDTFHLQFVGDCFSHSTGANQMVLCRYVVLDKIDSLFLGLVLMSANDSSDQWS